MATVMTYLASGIAIVVCAGAGAFVAWTIVSALGWEGTGGAVLAVVVAMVAATLLFALAVALGKALRLLK